MPIDPLQDIISRSGDPTARLAARVADLERRLDGMRNGPLGPGTEDLCGVVLSTGVRNRGSGFTCVRLGLGWYRVSFQQPFASTPVFVGLSNALIDIVLTAESTSLYEYQTFNPAGALVDASVWFIVKASAP